MGIELVLSQQNTGAERLGRITFKNGDSGLRDDWSGIYVVAHEM